MKKIMTSIFILLWSLMFSIDVFAAGSTVERIGEPLPSMDLDVNWVIFKGAIYKNGKLIQCKFDMFQSERTCDSKEYDPQEVIERKIGKEYKAVGISPYVDQFANELGIVLYYKKKN